LHEDRELMNCLHWAFVGRLAADVELQFTANGVPLVSMNVAVLERKAAGSETTGIASGISVKTPRTWRRG
jgi:single-stranded DNA-binding protein